MPFTDVATELTTGADLVKLQLHVAQGGHLEGEVPTSRGHAIEVRVNAEDAERAFAPAPGRIVLFQQPGGAGIRIDTGFVEGDAIAPEFDSMLAKVADFYETEVDNAVDAIRAGAADFLEKPFDLDEMRVVVSKTLEQKRMALGLFLLFTELGTLDIQPLMAAANERWGVGDTLPVLATALLLALVALGCAKKNTVAPEPARLRIIATPPNASVYIDGNSNFVAGTTTTSAGRSSMRSISAYMPGRNRLSSFNSCARTLILRVASLTLASTA